MTPASTAWAPVPAPDGGPRPGSDRYDLIVVGLGAMGAATAYQAQRRGLQVLGIDRHDPPHELGSTHAETRITRLAVGEGDAYLPFVRRSHEIWRELEELTGETLLHDCGGMIVTGQTPVAGQRWADFVTVSSEVAARAGVEFASLSPEQAEERLPMVSGLAGTKIGFEPTAGVVMAERAVAIQIALARRNGAIVRTGERVTGVVPDTEAVEVVTDRGRYTASHVVLAAGPWLADLADPTDGDLLTVTRQVVFWFEVDDLDRFRTDVFPFVMLIGESDEDYLAIFPTPPGATPALKVLGEQFLATTDPDSVDRTVSDAEIDAFYERLVRPRIAGVGRRCVKTVVCLYTSTPDDHFLIDADPRSDRITVMSPCSGHGFKHSPALGEAVAERIATGTSTNDLGPFRRNRSRADQRRVGGGLPP